MRQKLWPIGFSCVFLAGCASWSRHGVIVVPPRKIRVAVLPVQFDTKIKHLKNLETVPAEMKSIPDETSLIQERIHRISADITRSLSERLTVSHNFEVVAESDVYQSLNALGAGIDASRLKSEELAKLGRALNAQTLLATRVVGYGKVKKSWLFYWFGSGWVEAAAQGVVAAKTVDNKWVAVGIALEDVLQEAVIWGGGLVFFHRTFTPVILESELVSGADGKAIWDKTTIATINRKALKRLPKEEQRRKEIRLQLTYQKAEEKLINSLEKAAAKRK